MQFALLVTGGRISSSSAADSGEIAAARGERVALLLLVDKNLLSEWIFMSSCLSKYFCSQSRMSPSSPAVAAAPVSQPFLSSTSSAPIESPEWFTKRACMDWCMSADCYYRNRTINDPLAMQLVVGIGERTYHPKCAFLPLVNVDIPDPGEMVGYDLLLEDDQKILCEFWRDRRRVLLAEFRKVPWRARSHCSFDPNETSSMEPKLCHYNRCSEDANYRGLLFQHVAGRGLVINEADWYHPDCIFKEHSLLWQKRVLPAQSYEFGGFDELAPSDKAFIQNMLLSLEQQQVPYPSVTPVGSSSSSSSAARAGSPYAPNTFPSSSPASFDSSAFPPAASTPAAASRRTPQTDLPGQSHPGRRLSNASASWSINDAVQEMPDDEAGQFLKTVLRSVQFRDPGEFLIGSNPSATNGRFDQSMSPGPHSRAAASDLNYVAPHSRAAASDFIDDDHNHDDYQFPSNPNDDDTELHPSTKERKARARRVRPPRADLLESVADSDTERPGEPVRVKVGSVSSVPTVEVPRGAKGRQKGAASNRDALFKEWHTYENISFDQADGWFDDELWKRRGGSGAGTEANPRNSNRYWYLYCACGGRSLLAKPTSVSVQTPPAAADESQGSVGGTTRQEVAAADSPVVSDDECHIPTGPYLSEFQRHEKHHRGFGNPDAKVHACPCQIEMRWFRKTNKLIIRRSVANHNHQLHNRFYHYKFVKTYGRKVFDAIMQVADAGRPTHLVVADAKRNLYADMGVDPTSAAADSLRVPSNGELLTQVVNIAKRKGGGSLRKLRVSNLEELEREHGERLLDPRLSEHLPCIIGLSQESSTRDNSMIRFGLSISTRANLKLLARAAASGIAGIYVDATFNITTNNYKLVIVGITDAGGTFFPICYSLVKEESGQEYGYVFEHIKQKMREVTNTNWSPKFVQADQHTGLTAGVAAAFPEFQLKDGRLTCYFHAMMNITKRIVPKGSRSKSGVDLHYEIKRDFAAMARATKQAFPQVRRLFEAKWQKLSTYVWDRLERCTYFKDGWTSNWGAAAVTGTVMNRTNNVVERFNRLLKSDVISYRSRPFDDALTILLDPFNVVSTRSQRAEVFRFAIACDDGYYINIWNEAIELCNASKVQGDARSREGKSSNRFGRKEDAAAAPIKYKSLFIRISDNEDPEKITAIMPMHPEHIQHLELLLKNAKLKKNLFDGSFEVFDQAAAEYEKFVVCTISTRAESMKSVPSLGSSCSCNWFLRCFFCPHVAVLAIQHAVLKWPSSMLTPGSAVSSHGLTRPKSIKPGNHMHRRSGSSKQQAAAVPSDSDDLSDSANSALVPFNFESLFNSFDDSGYSGDIAAAEDLQEGDIFIRKYICSGSLVFDVACVVKNHRGQKKLDCEMFYLQEDETWLAWRGKDVWIDQFKNGVPYDEFWKSVPLIDGRVPPVIVDLQHKEMESFKSQGAKKTARKRPVVSVLSPNNNAAANSGPVSPVAKRSTFSVVSTSQIITMVQVGVSLYIGSYLITPYAAGETVIPRISPCPVQIQPTKQSKSLMTTAPAAAQSTRQRSRDLYDSELAFLNPFGHASGGKANAPTAPRATRKRGRQQMNSQPEDPEWSAFCDMLAKFVKPAVNPIKNLDDVDVDLNAPFEGPRRYTCEQSARIYCQLAWLVCEMGFHEMGRKLRAVAADEMRQDLDGYLDPALASRIGGWR